MLKSEFVTNTEKGEDKMYEETKKISNRKISRNNCVRENSNQKKIRLVCIFPERTTDEENVKSEVRSILHMELKHQLHQMG